MARKINRLSARTVATVTKPGRHADGGNLYLNVSKTGAKSWVFMFRWQGGTKEIGFGSIRNVALADARVFAVSARAQLARGVQPTGPRSSMGGRTFADCLDQVLEAMRPKWRSSKHAAEWERTLRKHGAPLLNLPVDKIDTEAVLAVLKPLWANRRETASRVRSRIEHILDAAKAQGFRQGENPARWKGHLERLLSDRQKIEGKHHDAMPYANVPAFIEKLRAIVTLRAKALEFCILTASRSREVLGARRSEFDLDRAIWTVPAERMKTGKAHQVPLSERAVEIVRNQPDGEFVFPLSGGAMLELLKRQMKVKGVTVHGFRSSFRDWAGDCTRHERDVVESALAHAIENRTEAAYRRSTAIEKRRLLMEDWAKYCGAPNVIPFRKEAPA